ncbi:MAG: S1 family peptidase [Pseudomonadota bacterium]
MYRQEHASGPRFSIARAVLATLAMMAPWTLPAAAPTDATPISGDDLSAALRRDLSVDARQLAQYLDVERAVMTRTSALKRSLGVAYGGTWIERTADGRFRMIVAATDEHGAARARAMGFESRIVPRSLARLENAKARLDGIGRQRRAASGIHAWYVDVATNQVVIEVAPGAASLARTFAASSGVDADVVRFEPSTGAPQTTQIVGGQRYNLPGNGGCSLGFAVMQGADTGFVTAGHCGSAGTPTTGTNGLPQGVFAGAIFPGNDMAWVRITHPSSWPLSHSVTNYASTAIPVIGSTPAPVGGMICRSGAKTGYRCGNVRANNVTVNYPQGAVYGLTSTSACIGGGDSGGAYITPSGHAQGVASGGKNASPDNCGASSPVSYHQPIQPILAQFGLTLFVGQSPAPPIITRFACPERRDSGLGEYVCRLEYVSNLPATTVWTGMNAGQSESPGASEAYGTCGEGQWLWISATVTNAMGASTSQSDFTCIMDGLP